MKKIVVILLICASVAFASPVANETSNAVSKDEVSASTEKVAPEEVTYTLIASSKVPSESSNSVKAGASPDSDPSHADATTPAATTAKVTRPRRTTTSRTTTTRASTTPRTPRPKRTRSTKAPATKPSTEKAPSSTAESKTAQSEIPLTRQELLKLIETEMIAYEKKQGGSPLSSKNLTMISNRILKFLLENGTSVGVELKENKSKNLITLVRTNKQNLTISDKIYGEGTEMKLPPVLEHIVQRIQSSWSIYKYDDQSRQPVTTEENATLRETPDDEDDDDDEDSKETSTLSNEEVFSQLEEELSEYLDPNGNGTAIKLPTLIKTAYDKFTSWLIPTKPNAKEEAVEETSEEDEDENTKQPAEDGSTGGNKKKPSIIKTAYDAIETLWSIFDESDGDDDEEKAEAVEGPEKKESPDSDEDKDGPSETLYDFLNLAYTLYEAS